MIDGLKIEIKNKRTEQKNKLTNILESDEDGKPVLKLTPIKKTAINTATEKDYTQLMKILECGGWQWNSGDLPTTLNFWVFYKEKTCISGESVGQIFYGPRKFYQNNRYKIRTPQEFYDAQKPPITPEILREVNDWFENRGEEI